jgi:hypothetical protein
MPEKGGCRLPRLVADFGGRQIADLAADWFEFVVDGIYMMSLMRISLADSPEISGGDFTSNREILQNRKKVASINIYRCGKRTKSY